jgi:DNA polymerase III alpha subunit
MFNQLITAGEAKKAEDWFKRFVLEFGDNFYGEIQFNELRDKDKWGIDQKQLNDFIIEMCNKYDVQPLIAGDVHYAFKEDSKLQDIIISAMMRKPGASVDETKESFVHAKHLYYHNSEDFFFLNKEFVQLR